MNVTPDAERVLSQIGSMVKRNSMSGYRIGIFFDNGADARAKATAAKNLFAETFPSTSVYMSYESPYYKVAAGDCLTSEEAIILHDRIKGTFPKAYIMREPMKLSDFTISSSIVTQHHIEEDRSIDTTALATDL